MSERCINTPAPRPASRAQLRTAAIIALTVDRYEMWRARTAQRRRLDSLSDHMLKDIGISRHALRSGR